MKRAVIVIHCVGIQFQVKLRNPQNTISAKMRMLIL